MLQSETTEIDGVLTIRPRVFQDGRGVFMETYHQDRYREAGIAETFVQDNFSRSVRQTLRGLHYQLRRPQAKLITVLSGEVFDVCVDIREGSPTRGRWVGRILSAANRVQMFIPKGFAHGFCVLSDHADVSYKCTDVYAPDDEYGVLWHDPAIGIAWPVDAPILSTRDAALRPLAAIPNDELPVFRV